VTLDRKFYSLLLVTVPIRDIGRKVLQSSFGECAKRDIGQNVLSLLLVTVPIRDIGRNVLQSSFVTVPIRDIGQNVLQTSVQTVSSNSPQLLPHFLPNRIPRGGLY